ncbi:MAG: calcium-binding protein, partial [Pseudomonadota bacterium]
ETLYQTLKNSVVSPFETSDLEAVVLGTGRSDQITADARGSYIDALLGNDTVMGGAGSDILAATPGNDTLTGGAGRDYAVFTGDFSDFLFHVVTTGSVNTLIINHDTVASGDEDLGSESITEIERLIFDDIIVRTSDLITNVFRGGGIVNGTNGNDFLFATLSATINGFLGDDRLTGSQQNDTLNGGGGNDVLLKSEGQDEINGGNGVDTLIFANNSGANSNIIVDLRTGSSFDGNSGNTDILNSVESIVVQAPRGSKLYGNAEANSLSGNLGKDTIVGRGGDDLLRGDAERDILIGGNGVDTILGGSGGDILLVSDRPRKNVGQTYDGGIGFDAIVYTHDVQHYFTSIGAQLPPDLFDDELSKSGPVIINVRRGEVQRMSQNGETVLAVDTLTDIEAFVGSAFKDTLIGGFAVDEDGNQLSQSINGSAGADLLYTRSIRWSDGGDGNDTVVALIQTEEEHSQSFDGGSGFDVLQLDKIAGARTAIGGPGGQRIQVFRADDLQSLGSGSTTATSRESLLFSGSVEGFEEIILGSADDEITFTPLGSTRIVVRGGDGND